MESNATSETAPTAPERAPAESKRNQPQKLEQALEYPVTINVKTLMEAGAHFGHQTQRWNPKMLPFIFGQRNGVHIINLDLTIRNWEKVRKAIIQVVSDGGSILFCGTKQQAREVIEHEARRSGAFFVSNRWLGGTLTNFQTIKNSIERLKKLEGLLNDAQTDATKVRLNKKERLDISRQCEKLERALGGIRNMRKPPNLIFVVDITKEHIAISEARRMSIPVVALVDTNCDPGGIDFPIPANDDAARTVRILTAAVADAVIEGKQIFQNRVARGELKIREESESEEPRQRGYGGRDRRDRGGDRGGDRDRRDHGGHQHSPQPAAPAAGSAAAGGAAAPATEQPAQTNGHTATSELEGAQQQ